MPLLEKFSYNNGVLLLRKNNIVFLRQRAIFDYYDGYHIMGPTSCHNRCLRYYRHGTIRFRRRRPKERMSQQELSSQGKGASKAIIACAELDNTVIISLALAGLARES